MRYAGAFLLGWISAVSTAVAIMLLRDHILSRRFQPPRTAQRGIRAAQSAGELRLPTLYFRDTHTSEDTDP